MKNMEFLITSESDKENKVDFGNYGKGTFWFSFKEDNNSATIIFDSAEKLNEFVTKLNLSYTNFLYKPKEEMKV